MANLKENYCYVSYSDTSAALYTIGLMPYSMQDNGDEVKSFAFSINFVNPKGYKSLKNEKDIKEYTHLKHFFGAEGDEKAPDGSLGGRGNTRLKNAEDEYFFGYIFSSRSGQKALEWFASRSAEMPTKEELEEDEESIPEEIREDEEKKARYITQMSRHSLEELALMLDVKLKKAATKTTGKFSAPKLIKGAKIDAPIKEVKAKTPTLPSKTAQIAGIPTSRKVKEDSNKNIQDAIDTIFKALIDGKITEDSEFNFLWEDPTGETAERDEDETDIPEVYKGFAGTRDSTKSRVKTTLKNRPEDDYNTTEIQPTLVFRLMSHRKVAKS